VGARSAPPPPRPRGEGGGGARGAPGLLWWAVRGETPLLEEARGAVQIARDGATRAGRDGQRLRAADLVLTEAGTARLRLEGNATVWLDEGATLVVGRRPDAASVMRGRAAFDVSPGHGPFRVSTPAGEVAVTGTAFEIEVAPQAGHAPGEVPMTRKMRGALGAAAVGAVALVHVTRGTVLVSGAGQSLPLGAGESAQLVSGRAPERSAPAPSLSLADRLEQQNATLRLEIERLRSEIGRRRAEAAALPRRGAIDSPRDPRAPLTTDERKLLGMANLVASAGARQKLAALFQERHGKAPPETLDEMALARDLVSELRLAHIGVLGTLPRGADVPAMVAAGLPPTAARAIQVLQERNHRVQEELARTLPPERAAAVAGTIATRTHVGLANDKEFAEVSLGAPPPPGEPLPLATEAQEPR
jgi:hypothetical protein